MGEHINEEYKSARQEEPSSSDNQLQHDFMPLATEEGFLSSRSRDEKELMQQIKDLGAHGIDLKQCKGNIIFIFGRYAFELGEVNRLGVGYLGMFEIRLFENYKVFILSGCFDN